MSSRFRAIPATALAALTLGVAACGGEGEGSTTNTTTTATSSFEQNRADREAAHIDPSSGDYKGLEPDTRGGGSYDAGLVGELSDHADAAGCELQLGLEDEGKGLTVEELHISPDAEPPEYATNPPTSGIHSEVPTADGAYLGTPPPAGVLHSLEHGRVAIQYSPDLSKRDQFALRAMYEFEPEGTLLFPNPEMPYELGATAWTNLIGCPEFSSQAVLAIAAFRAKFIGKGPEDIPL